MNNLCNNIKSIKYIFIILKYIIPIILTIIGFIKLVLITNTKKAIKRFIVYTLIGLFICIITILVEKEINKSCETYNKLEPQTITENIQNQENKQEQSPEKETIKEENKIETIDGVTYVNGIMIVNKTYSLPETFRAPNSEGYEYCTTCLTSETINAFNEMKADALSLGLNIYISSGFRSYSYQENLYNNYVAQDGKELADTYSARPGHSEHQTGLAFDLNTIDDSFAYTPEGQWVKDNCQKYGLILRYPKGKEDKTGYQYESWHLRYVGTELAEKLYNNGNWITLEEYFNLTSTYE